MPRVGRRYRSGEQRPQSLSITLIVSGAKHLAETGFFAALRMTSITGGIEWKLRTFVR
jgi:hypothetical protein